MIPLSFVYSLYLIVSARLVLELIGTNSKQCESGLYHCPSKMSERENWKINVGLLAWDQRLSNHTASIHDKGT